MKCDTNLNQSQSQSMGKSNSNSNGQIKSKGSYHDTATAKSLHLRSSISPFAHAQHDTTPEWLSIPTTADDSCEEAASLLDNGLDDLLYKSLDLEALKDLKPVKNIILTRTRTESMLAFVSER